MNINTFWKQPAKGFTEETRGRREEEISKVEEQIGFKYPNTYRELMKLQNGGLLRKSAFFLNGICKVMLCNGATLEGIPLSYYSTLKEVLAEGEDELPTLSPEYVDYDRLVIISGMYGHSWMCFDYGWNQKEAREEPEICFFEEDYTEIVRIANFDEFVKGLAYSGYESCDYFFGINSAESIEHLVYQMEKALNIKFKEHTDDRYGWYNFEKWYQGKINVESDLDFSIRLSPNQFLNNTYLFQEHHRLTMSFQ